MRLKKVFVMFLVMSCYPAWADVPNDADGLYDSTSLVDTNSTTNTTSNVTSNNTNTNTNTNNTTVNSTSTSTNVNTNNNTVNQTVNSTSSNVNTNTNNNTNVNTSTSTNTNINTNNSTIDQTTDSTINQTTTSTVNQTNSIDQTVDSTSTNTNVNTNTNTNSNTNVNKNDSNVTQRIESPPASAIAPSIQAGGNDSCIITASGAVQTQILGISGGTHIRDVNCERIKNSKTLYNMGMKVAAVSLMCQDPRVFEAMKMAGTPCPFEGMIGEQAANAWENNPEVAPTAKELENRVNDTKKGFLGGLGAAALLLLIL